MKLKFFILGLIYSFSVFGQDSDSLLFEEIKNDCQIIAYKNAYWKTYFGNQGEFIKAFSIRSRDKMVDFSVSMSTQDTIYKFQLAAFGNIWVTTANSIDAIGKYGANIHIDNVPITVKYDENLKKYLYQATLQVQAPFKDESDKELLRKMYDLASCKIYKIYVFEKVFSEAPLFFPCFTCVFSQSLDSDRKYLIQQSISGDIKEAKQNSKSKTIKKGKGN